MRQWAGLAARLVTGGVWIYAGAPKLPGPDDSVAAVRAYELLPGEWVVTAGHLLPILELVVGAMLVVGVLGRGAAVVE